jgi:hypothetical protein
MWRKGNKRFGGGGGSGGDPPAKRQAAGKDDADDGGIVVAQVLVPYSLSNLPLPYFTDALSKGRSLNTSPVDLPFFTFSDFQEQEGVREELERQGHGRRPRVLRQGQQGPPRAQRYRGYSFNFRNTYYWCQLSNGCCLLRCVASEGTAFPVCRCCGT